MGASGYASIAHSHSLGNPQPQFTPNNFQRERAPSFPTPVPQPAVDPYSRQQPIFQFGPQDPTFGYPPQQGYATNAYPGMMPGPIPVTMNGGGMMNQYNSGQQMHHAPPSFPTQNDMQLGSPVHNHFMPYGSQGGFGQRANQDHLANYRAPNMTQDIQMLPPGFLENTPMFHRIDSHVATSGFQYPGNSLAPNPGMPKQLRRQDSEEFFSEKMIVFHKTYK